MFYLTTHSTHFIYGYRASEKLVENACVFYFCLIDVKVNILECIIVYLNYVIYFN